MTIASITVVFVVTCEIFQLSNVNLFWYVS